MLFLAVRPVNFFHEFFSKLRHFPWIDFIILSKKFILKQHKWPTKTKSTSKVPIWIACLIKVGHSRLQSQYFRVQIKTLKNKILIQHLPMFQLRAYDLSAYKSKPKKYKGKLPQRPRHSHNQCIGNYWMGSRSEPFGLDPTVTDGLTACKLPTGSNRIRTMAHTQHKRKDKMLAIRKNKN